MTRIRVIEEKVPSDMRPRFADYIGGPMVWTGETLSPLDDRSEHIRALMDNGELMEFSRDEIEVTDEPITEERAKVIEWLFKPLDD